MNPIKFIIYLLILFTLSISKGYSQILERLNYDAYNEFRKGNYDKAIQVYKKIRQETRKKWGAKHHYYAIALNSLATLYQIRKDYAQAESLYKRSIKILKKAQPKLFGEYLNAYHFLAGIYFRQKKYNQAIPLYKKVIELSKEHFKNTGKNASFINRFYSTVEPLCLTLDQTSKFTLSRAYPDYVTSLHNLAYVHHSRGQYQKAAPLYQEMKRILHKTLRYNAVFLTEQEKKKYLDRNEFYFGNYQRFALDYVAKNPSKKEWLIELFNLQLTRKAQLLNNQRKRLYALYNTTDSVTKAKFDDYFRSRGKVLFQIDQNKWQIHPGPNFLAKLKHIQQLEKELSLAVGIEAINQEAVNFNTLQKELEPNTAAVDFVRLITDQKQQFDTLYLAMIVTPKARYPHIITLKNGGALETSFANYYKQAIELKRTDRYSYKAYWQPIAQYLKKHAIKKVFIAPDGIYHQINLNTLVNPANGQYVAQEIIIHLTPNLKEILTYKQQVEIPISQKGIVRLIGRPDYRMSIQELQKQEQTFYKKLNTNVLPVPTLLGYRIQPSLYYAVAKKSRGAWDDLPGTQKEVESIQAILSKHSKFKIHTYLGKEALELVVKKTKAPQILHMATHGFFIPDSREVHTLYDDNITRTSREKRPHAEPLLRSGVVLAGAEGFQQPMFSKLPTEDGILTAYEVSALNLHKTSLVVLSACETGLGKIENGEGVYGLQRAFLIAGAKSVLMSLWIVDDQATQMLMTQFYKAWIHGKHSKRQALKLAQEYVRNYQDNFGNKPYASPYYWGAFVMIGQ